jgi:hypothetical protein
MGRRETACELPAQVPHLPATMRIFTKSVNRKAAAFWNVFNAFIAMETADYTKYELTLKLKPVVLVLL